MSNSSPSEENKALFKLLFKTLEEIGDVSNISVINYRHDTEPISIEIVFSPNNPSAKYTTYSTLGLSDYSMYEYGDSQEYPVRLELIGVAQSDIAYFSNIMATLAFYVMRQSLFFYPGAILPNIVPIYDSSSKLKHIYFSDPFFWSPLSLVEMKTKKVAWLWAFPVTDAEEKYISKHGSDEFESLLEKNEVNVFDMNRSSII